MKARKINLKDYTVEGFDQKKGKIIQVPYQVRKSIDNILLATGDVTSQRLPMGDLLRNAELGRRVLAAKDSIILPENEFQLIKRAFEAFKLLGKNEVELCKRIAEAKTVEVKEEKKVKKKCK